MGIVDMAYNHKEQQEKNLKAYTDPLPGDYWNELFCPYFVVLEVQPDSMIICDVKKEVDSSHWTWDLEKAEQVTMDYMKRVKYQSIDGFVADVNRMGHDWAVAKWTELGCPFKKLATPVHQIGPTDFRTMMEQGL
jgi:hypothetical protein